MSIAGPPARSCLRQPFGGMGKSAFGPGIKAGGPNYVAQLMRFEETGPPETAERITDLHLREFRRGSNSSLQSDSIPISPQQVQDLLEALGSYTLEYEREFQPVHDHFRLLGQDNLRRYLPGPRIAGASASR